MYLKSVVARFMLFDLVDVLQKKRRLFIVAACVVADFWLLALCSHTLAVHRSGINARIHDVEISQNSPVYQSDTLDISNVTAGMNRAVGSAEVGMLRAIVAATDGVTRAENGALAVGKATLHAMGMVIIATLHGAGDVFAFMGRVAAFPFIEAGRGIGYAFSVVTKTANSNVASVIQPQQNSKIPVITPEQAQQVSLIQSGTLNFEPVKPIGTGGACDSGAGNGGYPMPWCNAPLDSMQTVSYSADHINRECTSYAYWYFTTIEGHLGFHVTGNANRWAYTSSYPVHRAPAIGAIAVETAGAYGHVAVVQALPGQIFQDKTVPAGYALVSEMNYDWQGHFRYSYSPLGKFSAYIYP